jgi:hypothetical protein
MGFNSRGHGLYYIHVITMLVIIQNQLPIDEFCSALLFRGLC